jgi:uncharacterized surface protein with fasciclin (FAS1) repeats
MKQTQKYFILLYVILTVFGISCSKEFEEHYNPERRIDKNIVQILSEDPDLTEFVKIIDKLDLRRTLGEAAIYTCFAPTNEQVNEYFKSRGFSSVNDAPELELRRYVNNHFINGMYYKYDIEKKYKEAITGLNPTKATFYTTRSEASLPAKSIRIFTPSFFTAQQDDYKALYNIAGNGFMIGTAKISEIKFDIDASNGVIHVLQSPLEVMPRTDAAIAGDSEVSVYNKWLETTVTYSLGEKDEFGWVDTALIKSYSIGRNLADENVLTTMFVPTNEALMNYFKPYLPDLYNTIDSVPKLIISEVLKSSVLADTWFKSDIVRNNPELRTNNYAQVLGKIAPTIVGAVSASNSIIYKVNKMLEPPKLNSVEGGVYMKKRIYGQWDWMFQHTTLESGLTDGLYFQHGLRTILLQPDEAWGFPLAEDMDAATLLIRQNACRTGILNIDVRSDGGFRKRFYPTEFGYVLFDNNRFTDYTGNSVSLLKSTPTWERSNGAIYEIDGFLTPMNKTDVTRTVYSLIQKDPELSLFTTACTKSGLIAELNLTGFFSYTVMAPTNSAIQAAGLQINSMTAEALKNFVNAYIIPNRYVFSDGVSQGNMLDKGGHYLTISGAWDSFSITNTAGKSVKPVASNLQGCNGVIHKINQVF